MLEFASADILIVLLSGTCGARLHPIDRKILCVRLHNSSAGDGWHSTPHAPRGPPWLGPADREPRLPGGSGPSSITLPSYHLITLSSYLLPGWGLPTANPACLGSLVCLRLYDACLLLVCLLSASCLLLVCLCLPRSASCLPLPASCLLLSASGWGLPTANPACLEALVLVPPYHAIIPKLRASLFLLLLAISGLSTLSVSGCSTRCLLILYCKKHR
jgi:hypothetical protein